MNYDEARELASGGWHWTTKRGDQIRTAEPCIRYIGARPVDELLLDPQSRYNPTDWERCEPHATKKEAEQHYWRWLLEEQCKPITYEDWQSCRVEGCGEPAKQGWGTLGWQAIALNTPLCPTHNTKEQFDSMHPFKPGVAVIHS